MGPASEGTDRPAISTSCHTDSLSSSGIGKVVEWLDDWVVEQAGNRDIVTQRHRGMKREGRILRFFIFHRLLIKNPVQRYEKFLNCVIKGVKN